jgi:hypothetical protein
MRRTLTCIAFVTNLLNLIDHALGKILKRISPSFFYNNTFLFKGQRNLTFPIEFSPSSNSNADLINWKMNKTLVNPFGVCQILGSYPLLGATPEFSNLNLVRNFNMEKERAHYNFYINFELIPMGNWSQTLFTIKYNDVLSFTGQYSTTNDSKCSNTGPNYRRIVIDHSRETKNEKTVKISFNDFNYSINGFWGVRNVVFSFLVCGGENTEYNSTSKKCECSLGFYLNANNFCALCPLGCVCSKLDPCLSCKFNFMQITDSSDSCFIPYSKSCLNSLLLQERIS